MRGLTKILYAHTEGICFCKHNYPYKYFINGFVNNDLIRGTVMSVIYLLIIIVFSSYFNLVQEIG